MLSKLVGHVSSRDSLLSAIHVPAAATAAVVTLAGVAGKRHFIHGVQWSYSDNPTGGRLTITVNAVTKKDIDITVGGPGGLGLALVGGANQAVVVTLASGAGAIVGKINVDYTTEPDDSN